MLTLRAVGRLQLLDEQGVDRLPVGTKSRGVLALLALSPNFSRSRAWVQDKLWSDRGPLQGAASLRQALSEIRTAFGPQKPALRADRFSVSLDPATFKISFQAPLSISGSNEEPSLFEDLDIKDLEFEGWLRSQRACARIPPGKAHAAQLYSIVVFRSTVSREGKHASIARAIFARLARSLLDKHDVHIIDFYSSDLLETSVNAVGAGVCVNLNIDEIGGTFSLVSTVSDISSKLILYADQLSVSPTTIFLSNELLQFMSGLLSAVVLAVSQTHDSRFQPSTYTLFHSARTLTYTLEKQKLIEADEQCKQAYQLRPHGSFLAWRAFIRILARFQYLDDDFLPDKNGICSLANEALENYPNDPVALSVGAHAAYLFGGATSSALQLAKLAVKADPLEPLGWSALSNLEIANSNLTDAINSADKAVVLSSGQKATYYFEFYRCMAAAALGLYSRASDHACQASLLSPLFAAPRRYLVALSATNGDRYRLDKSITEMKKLEPAFGLKSFLDDTYPVSTMRRMKLIQRIEQSASRTP